MGYYVKLWRTVLECTTVYVDAPTETVAEDEALAIAEADNELHWSPEEVGFDAFVVEGGDL